MMSSSAFYPGYQTRVIFLSWLLPCIVLVLLLVFCVGMMRWERGWRPKSLLRRVAMLVVSICVIVGTFVYFGWNESWMRFVRVTRRGAHPNRADESYLSSLCGAESSVEDACIVGGGWSFLLNKHVPDGRYVIYTHNWRGRIPAARGEGGIAAGPTSRTRLGRMVRQRLSNGLSTHECSTRINPSGAACNAVCTARSVDVAEMSLPVDGTLCYGKL